MSTDTSKLLEQAHEVYTTLRDLKENRAQVLDIKRPVTPKNWKDDADWVSREFDPENVLLDQEQHLRYWAWRIGGWRGLIVQITVQCAEHQATVPPPVNVDPNKPSSDRHRHILEDHDQERPWMPIVLASTTPQALQGMLEGNIIGRAYEDQDLYTEMRDRLTPGHFAGIYLGEIVNRKSDQGVQHPYPGRCLNWHEWVQVLGTMRAYIAAYDADQSTTLTDQVDSMSTSTKKEDFRFLPNDKIRNSVEVFINKCQYQYVEPGEPVFAQDPRDPRLDVAFRRIPHEVGWAVDVQARVGQHMGGSMSNNLMMLYQAVLNREFGKSRFETVWHSVCKVGDPWMAPTAEYFCSELAGSYWYQGGLNPELAGTIKMASNATTKAGSEKAITHAKYKPFFTEAQRLLTHPTEMEANTSTESEANAARLAKAQYLRANPRDEVWAEFEEKQSKLKKDLNDSVAKAEQVFTEVLTRELEELFLTKEE